MNKNKTLLNLVIILGLFLPFLPIQAATFDPGNIISDMEMTNYNTMTQQDIQNFFDKKAGAF